MSTSSGRNEFDSLLSLGRNVRRNIFGSSQEHNVNTQRHYDQSQHPSLLGAGVQVVEVDVHHEDEDELPSELPGSVPVNSTRRNLGQSNNWSLGRRSLDNIEEYPEEGDDQRGPEEYSTPSGVHFKDAGTSRVGNFTPEAIRPPRRADVINKKYEELYEKIRAIEQEKRELEMKMKLRLDSEKRRREEVEQERNEVKDLLVEAWEENHRPTNKSIRSGHLDLKGALQMVRNFAGENSDKLDGFLRSMESARRLIHSDLQDSLLDAILGSKLEGNALKQIKHRVINTFEQLKIELEALFGKTKNLVGLQTEFSKLQQKENESEEVTVDYLNGLCGMHSDISEEGKEAARTDFSTTARLVFEQGLRGKLQILVRASNYKTLHDACVRAIELEKNISGSVKGKFGVNWNLAKTFIGGKGSSMGRQFMGNCYS